MTERDRVYLYMGEIPEVLERCRIYDDVGGGVLPAHYAETPQGCSCEAAGHPEAWRRVCFLLCGRVRPKSVSVNPRLAHLSKGGTP